ncbi:mRNA cap guanine-N7 methyltransferase [Hypsibius exemplaris]|uniref:mRNA cap guanine-N(7) methyltransferase n=1 Tax=Hypsibius exemplaris TaxID=2072580 RepID=A0A1W0X6S1_HYPEX|nr:mRNA cap guanine-N7 methyltransferase [Hypsibius exemplaris]
MSIIAEHYNNLAQLGNEQRRESPIFYLRAFNNWVKSVSIGEALNVIRNEQRRDVRLRALDLCCGKGGDMKKWAAGRLDKVVFADIAEVSVRQAEERYQEMTRRSRARIFRAEFVHADCAAVDLGEKFSDPQQMFDIVSCQFSFHYSFESYERAERMLKNACDRLAPGGIFIGTIPDAHEIMRRLQASDSLKFGNDIYSVTFDTKEQQPLFGAKYHFFLQEHVDCPEFLVHFGVLMDMAEKLDMDVLYRSTFNEFFDEHSANPTHLQLLERMNGLETYPSDSLVGSIEDHQYDYAQEVIDHKLPRSKGAPRVGTLSTPEWEMASMYSVFAFQKKKGPSSLPDDAHADRRSNEQDGNYRGRDSVRSNEQRQQPPPPASPDTSMRRDTKRSRRD